MAGRPEHIDSSDTPRGFAFAIGAYLLWGFLPLYLKLLQDIPPLEVVAHRVLWSIPVAGLVLIATRRTRDLRAAFSQPGTLAMGALTATLVSVNWLVYVWAVTSGRALDGALGYYINPLFSVLLGALLLRERLSRAQLAAIGLAGGAVLVLTMEAGVLPWAALALTFSWGFYAYFKKSLPIGPNQGFLLEVLILAPLALGYVLWLETTGAGHFTLGANAWLLMGMGLATATPLMLYGQGAKGLRLSTIGMLQYIAPTMIMLVAVLVFAEPFGAGRMIAFPMIWAALVIYSASMLRQARRGRAA